MPEVPVVQHPVSALCGWMTAVNTEIHRHLAAASRRPLNHADLNCPGRYSFRASRPEGVLLPLRDPDTAQEDEQDEA
ncbi:hypothetical protein ACFVYE_15635 [Streptomyces sp. NPDC058239]|uniref:hypothetical protein n=1 Tax=Streptomyces sp. NPDC058239 TaxID=3346395 RepID=UPI0036EACA38